MIAGELEYPSHFQAANFVDTFELGVTTNINLLSNGRGEFGGGVKVTGGKVSDGGQGLIGAANADNGRGLRITVSDMSRSGGSVYGLSYYVEDASISVDSDQFFNLIDVSPATNLNCSFSAYNTLASNINGNVPTWAGYNADLSIDKNNITTGYGFFSNIRNNTSDGRSRYNFYAAGTAPNYFAGPVMASAFQDLDGNPYRDASTVETFQELQVVVEQATNFGELKAAMLVALEDYKNS